METMADAIELARKIQELEQSLSFAEKEYKALEGLYSDARQKLAESESLAQGIKDECAIAYAKLAESEKEVKTGAGVNEILLYANQKLEQKLSEALEVIRFYGSQDNYDPEWWDQGVTGIERDEGCRAREFLKKHEGPFKIVTDSNMPEDEIKCGNVTIKNIAK
jgi:hypothetical protein